MDRFEALVARVRAGAVDPRAGLFGPRSIVWRVVREVCLFLGGPRAILLQIAHPAIATAIAEHSAVRRDPLGRGRRTIEAMLTMVFGDLDAAIRAARQVHRRHLSVRGTIPGSGAPYSALDPSSGRWVLATLIETTFLIHDALVRPLTFEERADYYEQHKVIGALMGVPPEEMPARIQDFDAYVQEQTDALEIGQAARDEFAALLDSPPSAYVTSVFFLDRAPGPARLLDGAAGRGLARAVTKEITAALLPPRVREGYGLSSRVLSDGRRQALFEVVGRAYRALPERARFHPAYHQARRRVVAVASSADGASRRDGSG
jgi:uncharacterized protein (DUF2236 family)